ncbi:MAG: sugar ABC transporter permease [Bacilli bacterium]
MVRQGIKRKKVQDAITGWAFVSPIMIGMLLFLAFPLTFAFIISFSNYSLGTGFEASNFAFIGFTNYISAFHDEYFMQGMINILITCIGVPIGLVIALLLSSLLVSNPRFSIVFKSIYYVPTICGAVAITFIWSWMFSPMYGIINTMLTDMGLETVNFLGKDLFLPSMITIGIWSSLGTSILLLFASLKGISKSLYEAANIDGANFIQKFFHITLPAVSPTVFYILVTGIAGTFQEFTLFQVMRGGVVTMWSITPAWWIYNYASGGYGFNLGYASAMGVILGLFILIISAIQFIVSRLWVHYDS